MIHSSWETDRNESSYLCTLYNLSTTNNCNSNLTLEFGTLVKRLRKERVFHAIENYLDSFFRNWSSALTTSAELCLINLKNLIISEIHILENYNLEKVVVYLLFEVQRKLSYSPGVQFNNL